MSSLQYLTKMIVWMKGDVFDGFKAFSSIIRNFQIWPKKSFTGDHRIKGGTIGKNYLETCFYELKMIVLMRENVFDGLKPFSSIIRNFQIWPKKSLRDDHRTKGMTTGNKFYWNIFLRAENDCFDEREHF